MGESKGQVEMITRALVACFCSTLVCAMIYFNAGTFDTEVYVCLGAVVLFGLSIVAPESLQKIVAAVINRLPGWKK